MAMASGGSGSNVNPSTMSPVDCRQLVRRLRRTGAGGSGWLGPDAASGLPFTTVTSNRTSALDPLELSLARRLPRPRISQRQRLVLTLRKLTATPGEEPAPGSGICGWLPGEGGGKPYHAGPPRWPRLPRGTGLGRAPWTGCNGERVLGRHWMVTLPRGVGHLLSRIREKDPRGTAFFGAPAGPRLRSRAMTIPGKSSRFRIESASLQGAPLGSTGGAGALAAMPKETE